ncbi:7-dehydrocholesterol reductase-like isoform X2 [Henckelia pumila]|uniref:7-dehydrocholesterol reductase-like isoform X2 n=1 Tax=Henckelia pumila TaxID=405737 RepID=UPI003C6E5CA1
MEEMVLLQAKKGIVSFLNEAMERLGMNMRVSALGKKLYPCIGKNFDIKFFTNCKFGMMCWAVLAVTYCIKQLKTP